MCPIIVLHVRQRLYFHPQLNPNGIAKRLSTIILAWSEATVPENS